MTLLGAIGDDGTWIGPFGAIVLILAIYLLVRFQQKWLIGPTIKEMRELHLRRCVRATQALQGPIGSDWEPPLPDPGFPFRHWVELSTDGTVRVAGQTFTTSQNFHVMAQDERNIPRAIVSCKGQGTVTITSHGEEFRARFASGQWEVHLIPTNEIHSQ
jgi:hypothetical protein